MRIIIVEFILTHEAPIRGLEVVAELDEWLLQRKVPPRREHAYYARGTVDRGAIFFVVFVVLSGATATLRAMSHNRFVRMNCCGIWLI